MEDSTSVSARSSNSTNVRANMGLGQRVARALLAFGSRVAPYETSGFLVGAFTRTHREVQRSIDVGERLPFAERFSFEHAGKVVRGHSVDPEGTHPNESGRGPRVLLVHGWDGGSHQLLPFVAPLVARGRSVVLVDLPAHGASEGSFTTIREIADVIARILAEQGPFEAVIAHSVGAAATTLALLEGSEVGRVVLVAPPLSVEGQARAFASMVGADERALAPMLATIRGTLGREIDEAAWLRDVAALRVPALVFHDRGDRITSPDGSARLVSSWPGARLVPTEGLGHARILRDPGVVDEAVAFVVAPDSTRTIQ